MLPDSDLTLAYVDVAKPGLPRDRAEHPDEDGDDQFSDDFIDDDLDPRHATLDRIEGIESTDPDWAPALARLCALVPDAAP